MNETKVPRLLNVAGAIIAVVSLIMALSTLLLYAGLRVVIAPIPTTHAVTDIYNNVTYTCKNS